MPNQNRQTCLHRYTIEAINRDISPQKEIIEKLRGSHFNGMVQENYCYIVAQRYVESYEWQGFEIALEPLK